MSKSTLGRGLGDLLGSNRAGAGPDAPVKPPGAGLRTLIDGAQEPADKPRTGIPAAPPSTIEKAVVPAKARDEEWGARLVAIVALLGADLALIVWTVHHVATHLHALGVRGVLACVVSTLLAAVCGCAAVRVARSRG